MQVRPEPAKLETSHSDHWVATLVAASKASGIKILGHWSQWLPLVQPSFGDPRKKTRSLQDQPVHMELRGCSLQINTLRRHADSKEHRLAAEALPKGGGNISLEARHGNRKQNTHRYGLVFVRSHAGRRANLSETG